MRSINFVLGLGTGVVVMCLIFYFLYNIEVSRITESIAVAEPLVMTDDEIKVKAEELGMINAQDIPVNDVVRITDDEIIQRAEELGMIWLDHNAEIEPEPVEIATEPVADETQDEAEENEIVDQITENDVVAVTQNAVIEEAEDHVIITIPPGFSSGQISSILNDAGLIDDERDFTQHIIKEGLSRAINAGKYSIPKGSGYDEILKIIVKKLR